MKSIIVTFVAVIAAAMGLAQINTTNIITENIQVQGKCEICKKNIEKAAYKKNISKAEWNITSKIAAITYNNKKTNLSEILKNIALAGYDNEQFLAPEELYNILPACCKYERTDKKMAIMPAVDKTEHSDNHKHGVGENTVQDSNYLAKVFDDYFLVKDALVNTDGNTASVKAKGLLASLDKIKMSALPENVHKAWMNVSNELQSAATHIYQTKDIARQRFHFMNLSKNMYLLIKSVKPSGKIYYQFCPMANNGKGANWLSREETIKNPYYGSQMLNCGSTVETIK